MRWSSFLAAPAVGLSAQLRMIFPLLLEPAVAPCEAPLTHQQVGLFARGEQGDGLLRLRIRLSRTVGRGLPSAAPRHAVRELHGGDAEEKMREQQQQQRRRRHDITASAVSSSSDKGMSNFSPTDCCHFFSLYLANTHHDFLFEALSVYMRRRCNYFLFLPGCIFVHSCGLARRPFRLDVVPAAV